MIDIVEILGRSEQGITKPFLCRGSDDRQYYVKGRQAGRRSLLCEWTAGHLALALGLPVADFAIVNVRSELLRFGLPGIDLNALGPGPAFGSRVVARPTEFTRSDLQSTAKKDQQAILVFDWWVRNADRSLTELGGNPNLLWDLDRDALVVIDHNLAFDRGFSQNDFWKTHVFAARRDSIWDDLIARDQWSRRLSEALPQFFLACDTAPAEWWFEGDDASLPADFDREQINVLLSDCLSSAFWKSEP